MVQIQTLISSDLIGSVLTMTGIESSGSTLIVGFSSDFTEGLII